MGVVRSVGGSGRLPGFAVVENRYEVTPSTGPWGTRCKLRGLGVPLRVSRVAAECLGVRGMCSWPKHFLWVPAACFGVLHNKVFD